MPRRVVTIHNTSRATNTNNRQAPPARPAARRSPPIIRGIGATTVGRAPPITPPRIPGVRRPVRRLGTVEPPPYHLLPNAAPNVSMFINPAPRASDSAARTRGFPPIEDFANFLRTQREIRDSPQPETGTTSRTRASHERQELETELQRSRARLAQLEQDLLTIAATRRSIGTQRTERTVSKGRARRERRKRLNASIRAALPPTVVTPDPIPVLNSLGIISVRRADCALLTAADMSCVKRQLEPTRIDPANISVFNNMLQIFCASKEQLEAVWEVVQDMVCPGEEEEVQDMECPGEEEEVSVGDSTDTASRESRVGTVVEVSGEPSDDSVVLRDGSTVPPVEMAESGASPATEANTGLSEAREGRSGGRKSNKRPPPAEYLKHLGYTAVLPGIKFPSVALECRVPSIYKIHSKETIMKLFLQGCPGFTAAHVKCTKKPLELANIQDKNKNLVLFLEVSEMLAEHLRSKKWLMKLGNSRRVLWRRCKKVPSQGNKLYTRHQPPEEYWSGKKRRICIGSGRKAINSCYDFRHVD